MWLTVCCGFLASSPVISFIVRGTQTSWNQFFFVGSSLEHLCLPWKRSLQPEWHQENKRKACHVSGRQQTQWCTLVSKTIRGRNLQWSIVKLLEDIISVLARLAEGNAHVAVSMVCEPIKKVIACLQRSCSSEHLAVTLRVNTSSDKKHDRNNFSRCP